ncbi:MAG: haloacid dehalogenase-like hydrolase [Ignavibacteriales bacterium]|nr:haloacid dehalogenase-like hydrolase [Ignavibacteriales bacterium]
MPIRFKSYVQLLIIFVGLISCNTENLNTKFKNIDGFSQDVNLKVEKFLLETENHKGRKIAVFDGDGTVLGQVPHYLADECLYTFAENNPDRRSLLIDSMKTQSNVSLQYVQNRVHFMSGDSLVYWRKIGNEFFTKHYSNKIYLPMKELIRQLKQNNFEIWIITASPEAMYQQFLSESLNIPITNIIGVKSVISNGLITDQIILPVPQDHGKKDAIESFVQERPLLSVGNSRGDKEMIEYASKLHMIINPDGHIAQDQTESIAEYARKNGWAIVKINDVSSDDSPSISSKKFGVRLNSEHIIDHENK